MCGRYTLTSTPTELQSIFELAPADFREEQRYNIAPGQWVLVIRPDRAGRRVPEAARWGLVPSWAKDPEAGPKPINARAEGLADKPTFRGALRHGRCLIPASGFYEWRKDGKARQPFYIRPSHAKLFAFAGLFSQWAGADGELETCAIITTTPNAVMESIHDRMPVILAAQDWDSWLDPSTPVAAALALLRPCPAAWMEAYAVSARVGTVQNDDSDLITPQVEP